MLAQSHSLRRSGFVSVVCVSLIFCGSCNSTPISLDSSGSRSSCPVRVFCLRGLWDLFSWGLTDLAGELQQDGVDATAMSGPNWPDLADYLVKAYSGVDRPGPLVLIGHSYGTDNAVNVAKSLNEFQIPVRLLISLDGTSPAPIPPNVEHCIHLYIPSYGAEALPDELPGHPISLEPGNTQTDLQNIAVTQERFGPEIVGMTHFDIDSNPAIHRFVIDQILPLCSGSGPQRESIPAARAIGTALR